MASEPLSAPSAARQDGALGPYLRALAAHRLLVAVAASLALAAAVGWLSQREPTYEAYAELLVNPLPQDDETFIGLPLLRDSGDPTRTVQTAAALISSPQAASEAAGRLGGSYDRQAVRDAIDVEPQGESNILAINARADAPAEAARLANTYMEAALDLRRATIREQVRFALRQIDARRQALGGANTQEAADLASRRNQLAAIADGRDPTVGISARAEPPTSVSGAPAWLVLALALLAGLTVGMGAALLLEMLERSIRDEDELERLYPLPVLARVPLVSRRVRRDAGVTNVPPAVREAFRTIQVQLDQRPGRHRTIMLTSATTGDGKTSSAINLALGLVGGGHRVVLVDFDLRKPDVGLRLGIDTRRGLVSLLAGGTELSELLVPAPDLPALQVVPAGVGGGDAVLLEALARRLPQILADAAALADYVVLDTAPLGEVSDALRVATHVDDVIIVARPGHTNRANLEVMRDLLGRAGVTPSGFVLIGDTSGVSNSYYAYGASASRRSSEGRRPLSRQDR